MNELKTDSDAVRYRKKSNRRSPSSAESTELSAGFDAMWCNIALASLSIFVRRTL